MPLQGVIKYYRKFFPVKFICSGVNPHHDKHKCYSNERKLEPNSSSGIGAKLKSRLPHPNATEQKKSLWVPIQRIEVLIGLIRTLTDFIHNFF